MFNLEFMIFKEETVIHKFIVNTNAMVERINVDNY